MGQKVHPTGFRIGTIEPWRSRWYASKKDFPRMLVEDRKIREYIEKEFWVSRHSSYRDREER